MTDIQAADQGGQDRARWNARYEAAGYQPAFRPHPLALRMLRAAGSELRPPAGPLLELACGPSGSALLAAAEGRPVIAVDVSDVALQLLTRQATARGLGQLVTVVEADLPSWRPDPDSYPLVLCTGYWEPEVFAMAAAAVQPGGLLGWEALTLAARRERPSLPERWCLRDGEPAELLPPAFRVLSQEDIGPAPAARRRLLARRDGD